MKLFLAVLQRPLPRAYQLIIRIETLTYFFKIMAMRVELGSLRIRRLSTTRRSRCYLTRCTEIGILVHLEETVNPPHRNRVLRLSILESALISLLAGGSRHPSKPHKRSDSSIAYQAGIQPCQTIRSCESVRMPVSWQSAALKKEDMNDGGHERGKRIRPPTRATIKRNVFARAAKLPASERVVWLFCLSTDRSISYIFFWGHFGARRIAACTLRYEDGGRAEFRKSKFTEIGRFKW